MRTKGYESRVYLPPRAGITGTLPASFVWSQHEWHIMERGDMRREIVPTHDSVSALSERVSIRFFGIPNSDLGKSRIVNRGNTDDYQSVTICSPHVHGRSVELPGDPNSFSNGPAGPPSRAALTEDDDPVVLLTEPCRLHNLARKISQMSELCIVECESQAAHPGETCTP